MRLRGRQCLVKLSPRRTRSDGGLVLAEDWPAPICLGKVVQVGPLVRDVTPGDVVVFPPTVGEDMGDWLAVPHLLMPESEIAAVLAPDDQRTETR